MGPDEFTIRVNGFVLPVRLNLFEALIAIRKRTEPCFVWIDAICINQSDVDEKTVRFGAYDRYMHRLTRWLYGWVAPPKRVIWPWIW